MEGFVLPITRFLFDKLSAVRARFVVPRASEGDEHGRAALKKDAS